MLTINNTLDGYLKDVEILGNTIQNEEDLADIRSVGDKVEGQELYEIPVLSVGKNLFDKENFSESTKVTKKINLLPNTTYYIYTSNPMANGALAWLHEYNANGDKITNGLSIWQSGKFTTKDETVNVHFNSSVDFIDTFVLSTEPITEYEPYQEDKLTILSPVQLEKVGDVADRIIEKDGVLGVEKNIKDYVLTGNTGLIVNGANESAICLKSRLDDVNESVCLCDTVVTKNLDLLWNAKDECVGIKSSASTTGSTFAISLYLSRIGGNTLDLANKYLNNNPITVKYPTTQPMFIPLPHDQQVKLRTFANKTNISFLTEIEGTIKAQVPKSLGATVNTHTEQINNLNKELDRVKKLEESTVSTVTTESDFTTVEATSNGYFEDVKLEGKTLVNLLPNTVTGEASDYSNLFLLPNTITKSNTYTLIPFNLKHTNNIKLTISSTSSGENTFVSNITLTNGVFVFKCANQEFNYDREVRIRLYVDNTVDSNTKYVILEGDHTQNPPNGHIEGLKSVGQDVDEVSVESVNENLIVDINKYEVGGGWYGSNLTGSSSTNISINSDNSINLKNNGNGVTRGVVYTIKAPKYTDIFIHRNILSSNVSNNMIKVFAFDKEGVNLNIPREDSLLLNPNYVYKLNTGNNSTIKVLFAIENIGECTFKASITFNENFADAEADKKRLLYYNEETQAWEKPILREWDSIEKHSDGKYYYHVRSKEGDYVEGDESLNDCITDLTVSVKKLAEEKVYECTNIDLITYANETNYVVESGAIVPKSTLKVHNNISNVVSLLQKKVSLLESNITKYMVTQNRMQLASTYSADSVTFKVDYFSLCSDEENYDEDLYNLILNNILVGKDNYDYDKMFTMILDYASWNQISWEQFDILVGLMDMQHNPPVEELPTEDIIEEDIIENEETPVE